MTRECKRCKEVKSLEDFPKDARSREGRKTVCKTCQNKATRAWIEANPERRREHVRNYDKKNTEWVNAKVAKRRALIKGATVEDLDANYIEKVFNFYGRVCAACGHGGKGEITLDHVVPISKGGLHGYFNFQVLCWEHNMKKGNRSETDYRTGGILVGTCVT